MVISKIQLAYPLWLLLLVLSITIASNFSELVYEGLKIVPLYEHLPFQVIIPVPLPIIAFLGTEKNKANIFVIEIYEKGIELVQKKKKTTIGENAYHKISNLYKK